MLYEKLGAETYNKVFNILLILTIIPLIALIFLVACGKPAPEPVQTLPPATAQPVQLPSPSSSDEPEATPEPLPTPEPEVEPEFEPDEIEEPSTGSSISPDLIEFLDSYEAFIDEYCDFMKQYMANPTDFNLLMQYSAILSEYSKFTQAVDNYDTSTMNEAESLYFAEVTLRCSQKMLKALG